MISIFQPAADDEARLVHWCRMWLLAIAILHWIVFYLLTQTGPDASSGTVTRSRTSFAMAAGHSVDPAGARSCLMNLMLVQGASEHCERATRPERAGEAARERACRGVRGAKPLG